VKDKSLIKHMCLHLENADSLIHEVTYRKKLCRLKKPLQGRPAKFVRLFAQRSNLPEEDVIYVEDKKNDGPLPWADKSGILL